MEEPTPRRVPNLAHALIFIAFAATLLITFQLLLSTLNKTPAALQGSTLTIQHPILQLAMMAAIYAITIAAAWLFFPLLWDRPYLEGIRWNWPIARLNLLRLLALGLVLGVIMQLVTNFISQPKSIPIDEFFTHASTAWLITLFGTIIAPIFEETCFRGFLLPAFAIAYDWFALPRTPEAHVLWKSTTTLTPAALLFSSILSSVFFALLHAQQVAHLLPALLSLFAISLILCFVRIKTQSVAASILVHGAYNGFIFLTALIATGGYRHLDRIPH
ncbi:MAG TPA: CPBP family intramembrane glutamic endopeptidase [Acidobacteriaceae bacterium]|nr:CPBP family intramembrane glutamic endopeptidase [Acidobacteriaceae bacterium]